MKTKKLTSNLMQAMVHVYVTVCFGVGVALNYAITAWLGIDSPWLSWAALPTWVLVTQIAILNLIVVAVFHSKRWIAWWASLALISTAIGVYAILTA